MSIALKKGWLTCQFEAAWKNGWQIPHYQQLLEGIETSLGNSAFLPTADNIFRAYELVSPEEAKYVILGQDPYFQIQDGRPIAIGVAFGVEKSITPKASTAIHKILKGIYDRNLPEEASKTLIPWAEQKKILLLNVALTVPRIGEGGTRTAAGKHLPIWKNFTHAALKYLLARNPNVRSIAWGLKADKAYKETGICPVFSDHPTASKKQSDSSFAKFWTTEIGKSLKITST